MCGLFGILYYEPIEPDVRILRKAAEVQAHRGPDDSGLETFRSGRNTLVFGHQRLSIIDLSDAGHQPMTYGEGQGSITYNGELYNYIELRDELRQTGEQFTTQSDTEVLLAALHHWGARRALEQFNWMGAFAWFDRSGAKLVLARDAGSEKPLYYWIDKRRLVFASEIKTLLTLAGQKFSLDRDVVGQFIFQGLTDASTQTFFRGIRQLEAGTFIEVSMSGDCSNLQPVRYTPPVYPGDPGTMSLPDCIDEVRRLFIDSVQLRLRSDVPVGVLLSGGIDSSAIAAVTHSLKGSQNAPQLLSAISDDPRFDETTHIAVMERFLGQQAIKVTLRTDPQTLLQDLATINWFNDAPVTGLSTLAHYRMMEQARKLGLTVILSGQGADEILLGYRKFLGFYLQSLVRRGQYMLALGVLSRFLANRTIINQFSFGDAKRYLPFLSVFNSLFAGGGSDESTEGAWLRGWQPMIIGLGAGSLVDRQLLDIRNFSVPALCHYEDRMSMAMSREIRLPFLDSRLIDLLLRAPDDYKLRKGWTKYVFRKAMENDLPPEITWRKDKMGFSNPQGEWLKHELRIQVSEAFAPDSLIAQNNIVNSEALLRKYERYRTQPPSGGTIWYREIFAPFSLEIWMRQYDAWIA